LPAPEPLVLTEEAVIAPVKVLLVLSCGTFVVSTFRVTLPPRDTAPPPVKAVPAVTISVGFASIEFVTPPVAMLTVPLEVTGPPVNPAPVATLVTVPEVVPGKT